MAIEQEFKINNMQNRQRMLERWRAKLHSPASSVLFFPISPDAILQEKSLSGKPVACYETLFLSVLLLIVFVMVVIGFIGVQWNPLIGLAGVIITITFLMVEAFLFRFWSFSDDVKRARSILIFFLFIISPYFIKVL